MPAQDSCHTLNRQKLLDEVNRRNLKRELLAEEIGVTPRTLRRWLHGHTTQVQMMHLSLLAQNLGCALQDLIAEPEKIGVLTPAPDVHPILQELRTFALQAATPANFENATRLVQGSGGGLPFDIQAAALFEYARFAFHMGHTQQSRRSFERAVMKADAAGMDQVRFQSFLSLAHISSLDQDDEEGQALYLEQAEHVLFRMNAQHWRPYMWLMEAKVALSQGQLERALSLGQNAMEILGYDQDQHSLDLLEALDIMASIHQVVGSRRKAHEILTNADSIARSLLSHDHPMYGRLLCRLSSINGFLGAPELSCQQAQEAVRILDSTLPMQSIYRTTAWIELGGALSEVGLSDEGIEALKHGLNGNPSLEARLRTTLGLMLTRMGRYAEAMEEGRQAVELFSAQRGPTHPDTAAAIGRYAGSIQGTGDVATAEKMYGEAASLLQARDPFHVRILDQVRNRADCLIALGRHEEAAQILKDNRKIYTKRDESPLYQGKYSLLQAKSLAAKGQKQSEALQFAVEAKAHFENPGVDPTLRYETEKVLNTIRNA